MADRTPMGTCDTHVFHKHLLLVKALDIPIPEYVETPYIKVPLKYRHILQSSGPTFFLSSTLAKMSYILFRTITLADVILITLKW